MTSYFNRSIYLKDVLDSLDVYDQDYINHVLTILRHYSGKVLGSYGEFVFCETFEDLCKYLNCDPSDVSKLTLETCRCLKDYSLSTFSKLYWVKDNTGDYYYPIQGLEINFLRNCDDLLDCICNDIHKYVNDEGVIIDSIKILFGETFKFFTDEVAYE